MTEAQESAIRQEVDKFIKLRGRDYISFLEEVQRELSNFKDRAAFHEVIYRIYSRADKQIGGEPLKTNSKIAKKLSEERLKTPSMPVSGIKDIIGVTVVTYFTSERELVSKALAETQGILGDIIIDERKDKNEKGYYATHFIVKSDIDKSKKNNFIGLSCEIQVKTLLDDGWATKTHDLIYKPKSNVAINPELKEQMDILGDSIRLIERQSDIVKKLIEHEWQRDKKRRTAAQQQLLLALTKDPELQEDEHVRKYTAEIGAALRADLEKSKLWTKPRMYYQNICNFGIS
jgi:ppGpp synthetase/RelA/SpoT-type nucleotidyltranferase